MRAVDRHIVCICGSTRFPEAFTLAAAARTLVGQIVLTVHVFSHKAQQVHGHELRLSPLRRAELKALHMDKIALADEVLVLNVGGYIGDGLKAEIAYAEELGTPISYTCVREELST